MVSASSKEFLDIRQTTECELTREIIITSSQEYQFTTLKHQIRLKENREEEGGEEQRQLRFNFL